MKYQLLNILRKVDYIFPTFSLRNIYLVIVLLNYIFSVVSFFPRLVDFCAHDSFIAHFIGCLLDEANLSIHNKKSTKLDQLLCQCVYHKGSECEHLFLFARKTKFVNFFHALFI